MSNINLLYSVHNIIPKLNYCIPPLVSVRMVKKRDTERVMMMDYARLFAAGSTSRTTIFEVVSDDISLKASL